MDCAGPANPRAAIVGRRSGKRQLRGSSEKEEIGTLSFGSCVVMSTNKSELGSLRPFLLRDWAQQKETCEFMVDTISTVRRSTKGTNLEILSLRGRLDATSAPELREEFREFISGGHTRLVLDFSGVSFVDSSGLAVIITLLKSATASGGDVVLAALTPPVRSLLELTRLNKVFRIYDQVDAACEAFGV